MYLPEQDKRQIGCKTPASVSDKAERALLTRCFSGVDGFDWVDLGVDLVLRLSRSALHGDAGG